MTVTVGVRAAAIYIKRGGRRFRYLVGSLVNMAGFVILLCEALEKVF